MILRSAHCDGFLLFRQDMVLRTMAFHMWNSVLAWRSADDTSLEGKFGREFGSNESTDGALFGNIDSWIMFNIRYR